MTIIDMDAHPPLLPLQKSYIGTLDKAVFFGRLRRAGITSCCGTPCLPDNFSIDEANLQAVNDFAFKTASEYPDQYIPAVTVHPAYAEQSLKAIEAGIKHGLGLIGNIEADWLNSPDLKPLDDIMACAAALRKPVLIRANSLHDAEQAAARYPAQKLLIRLTASCPFSRDEFSLFMKRQPMVSVLLSYEMMICNYCLHTLITECPADRLIYGSGYPVGNPCCHRATINWELRDQDTSVKEAVFARSALALIAQGGENA